MSALVHCPNPQCGHPSRVSHDPPGRVFRCPRCQRKLRGGSIRTGIKTFLPSPEIEFLGTRRTSPSRNRPHLAALEYGVDSDSSTQKRDPQASHARGKVAATLDSAPKRKAAWADDFDEFLDAPPLEQARRDDGHLFRPLETDADSGIFDELNPRLGRYDILGVLGEGRYARVYLGYDPFLERSVALKVLRLGSLRSDKMKERFLGEARALARLRHPRIAPVYEAGREGEAYYIAMALIDGQSLAQLLTGHSGLLGARHACEIVADLAEALAHAHRQGIVHRDVKPENIQLDHHCHAYLIDFGIACQAESGEFSVETGCTLTGTPAYLAPELAHGEHAVALPSSDQYSLGAVFYELLCGRTPFSGPSLYVLYQAANQEPPSPRSINPTIPPQLAAICLKTLSTRPDRRYPSCDHFSASLRSWMDAPGEES